MYQSMYTNKLFRWEMMDNSSRAFWIKVDVFDTSLKYRQYGLILLITWIITFICHKEPWKKSEYFMVNKASVLFGSSQKGTRLMCPTIWR